MIDNNQAGSSGRIRRLQRGLLRWPVDQSGGFPAKYSNWRVHALPGEFDLLSVWRRSADWPWRYCDQPPPPPRAQPPGSEKMRRQSEVCALAAWLHIWIPTVEEVYWEVIGRDGIGEVVNLRLHGLSAGKRENGLYLPASIYGSAKPRIEGGGIM